MPENSNDRKIFSLLEVTKSIQKTLTERYQSAFWIKAEMNKLNHYKHSGHCYPELVEKKDGKVIAQLRSHLWRDDFVRTNNSFQALLNEPLKDGIKILFLARITFDPEHGLDLWILDIDPSYTLGDLEREKQETIQHLKKENIFSANKTKPIPLLPQRIAIISVETSKGYADFIDVIKSNVWHYSFFHMLFPSLLQGDKAVASIIHQLRQIKKIRHHFDVVAIIRGGGGDVGLSCYNHYALARQIATFPIPVITGIGHATNETVAEMVSAINAITPTKLAEFLIQRFHDFAFPVQEAQRVVVSQSKRLLADERRNFQSEVKLFRSATQNLLASNKNEVQNVLTHLARQALYAFRTKNERLRGLQIDLARATRDLARATSHEIKQATRMIGQVVRTVIDRHNLGGAQMRDRLVLYSTLQYKRGQLDLQNLEKNLENMRPENVLRRGYTITRHNGKVVKDIGEVPIGDTLVTTFFEGTLSSTVQSSKQLKNE